MTRDSLNGEINVAHLKNQLNVSIGILQNKIETNRGIASSKYCIMI